MWGFFYAARMDEIFTCPTLGASCIPRRYTPAYSSAPGRLARHRQQGRPRKARHTRPDAGHAAQGDRDGGGCWTACNVSGKVYNFGRLFLSIFIWIYFAKSIDNPYIYGYNIISPDKYGLQPQYTKTGGQKP